jgi:AAA+ ATPase superfamily predicted ATPase
MEFINRKVELTLLTERLEQFKQGKRFNTSHLAFLGLRRTGKTYLVKEFASIIQHHHKEVIPLFIDISKLTENISFFCDTLLSEFAKSYKKSYLEPDLDIFFHSFIKGKLYEAYKHYQKQTEPAKIFDMALKLLTLISQQQKLVIIFDEFQDILEFTKIKGLKTLDAIFRSELQNQNNIFYVITGSYPTILRDLIQNPQRKLYSHFEIYDIKNFNKEASLQLINLFKNDLPHTQKIALYKSCNGNPYLISLILQKVDTGLLGDLGTNFKNLLFDKKGAIYNHYEYLLEESLSKILNSFILRALLKEIALSNTELTLTELSKKI